MKTRLFEIALEACFIESDPKVAHVAQRERGSARHSIIVEFESLDRADFLELLVLLNWAASVSDAIAWGRGCNDLSFVKSNNIRNASQDGIAQRSLPAAEDTILVAVD